MRTCKFAVIASVVVVLVGVFAGQLRSADPDFWQTEAIKIVYATKIDSGLETLTAKEGKIAIVTGKLSHTNLRNASVSEKEIALAYKASEAAALITVQPLAIGLVRTKQTSWIALGPIAKGTAAISDEERVQRIEVSREEGKPVVFRLKVNKSHVAFAFPVPKDATGPFELRIGSLKKSIDSEQK